jgi:hypothetical protein
MATAAILPLSAGDGFPVLLSAPGLTSCRPLLSLLQEDDAKLKFCALQKMVSVHCLCAPGGCLLAHTVLPSVPVPCLQNEFERVPCARAQRAAWVPVAGSAILHMCMVLT